MVVLFGPSYVVKQSDLLSALEFFCRAAEPLLHRRAEPAVEEGLVFGLVVLVMSMKQRLNPIGFDLGKSWPKEERQVGDLFHTIVF
ncbi:MAG TPA: hypothetical protein VK857_03105, partial [Desulforhopalus sp.]|nr:hypothetical protein [Desulforhopalus sp.]